MASGEMRCTHCKDTAEDHVHVWRGTGWVLFCDWTKTNTFTPAAVPESAIEPDPQLGDVAICDCGNTISVGPKGWVHEDSDQRGCERAEPAASSAIEVAPQETSDVCPKCNGGGIKDDQGYTTVCWYCSGKGRVNFRPSVAPGEQNLISSKGEGEVGGSVPQNLPELIGGPVRPRVAKKLSHSQDKTHSRNAEETLKPTLTSPVAPGEAQRETDLARSLAGPGSHLTITCADSSEGARIVASWKDEQVREFAANWIARAEARQRLADDAIEALRVLHSPAVPSEVAPSREQRLEDALRDLVNRAVIYERHRFSIDVDERHEELDASIAAASTLLEAK